MTPSHDELKKDCERKAREFVVNKFDHVNSNKLSMDRLTDLIMEAILSESLIVQKRVEGVDKLVNYVKMNSKDETLLNLVREYEQTG